MSDNAETIGRYTLLSRIAVGGMASVHIGSFAAAADFFRIVAIKRMHPQLATDTEFVARFRDEARLSARLIHPNIVQTLDVVEREDELLLVMEYVDGVTLRELCEDASFLTTPLPLQIVSGIIAPVLHGLHAAHEATDDDGQPLGIVHRDISPHNIIIGRDGHAKILDFGVAKARSHQHVTASGGIAGKVAYLSPEQFYGTAVDRRTDVFAAGIVLWETITGRRLFRGSSEASTIARVLGRSVPPPSQINPAVPPRLDRLVLRALERDRDNRFSSAFELASELEATVPPATPAGIKAWLGQLRMGRLEKRAGVLADARRRSVRPQESRSEVRRSRDSMSVVGDTTVVASPSGMLSLVHDSTRATPSGPWRRRWIIGGLAGFFAIALLAWLFAPWSFSSLDAASSRTQAPARASGLATAPSSTASSNTGPRLAHPRNGDAHSSPETHDPEPGLDATQTRKATPIRATAEGRKPSPPPPRNCDPPTYLDSEGIRHFKKGCI